MTVPSQPTRLASTLGLFTVAGVASMAALLYCVPDSFVGALGLAPEGARRFQSALPFLQHFGKVSEFEFVWVFRALLIAVWLLWVGLIAQGLAGRLPPVRVVVSLALVAIVMLGLFCPPVLSRDVFAYVAYGRILFLHGLNPYLNDRSALSALGDQAAGFLVWSSPLPYGPLWTSLAAVLGKVGQIGGLYGEVLAHKLVSGAALLAAAIGAARLADLRESGRGRLTFAAIALNPLLLLEGPGSGHNDSIMMALLIWAAVLFAQRRHAASALLVGLATSVKIVACVAVPWLLLEEWRRTSPAQRWRVLLIESVAVMAPVVLLSLPFGGPQVVAEASFQQGGAPFGMTARWIAVTIVAGVSVWATRFVTSTDPTTPARWVTAWIPVAIVLVVVGTRQWFPWYVSWALIPSLAGWDERHRVLTTVSVTSGVLLMWLYTYRP